LSTLSDEEHSSAKEQFEAEEEERARQKRLQQQQDHYTTLSSMYGAGSHAHKIGLLGKVVIIFMFLSWGIALLLLIMSYLPFGRELFNTLIDFR
jgi:hypothetical protein